METYSHVVERYADPVGEVLAEQRDLGVALAEVVQHDEAGVHLHADADGLRGRAAGEGGGGDRVERESHKLQRECLHHQVFISYFMIHLHVLILKHCISKSAPLVGSSTIGQQGECQH